MLERINAILAEYSTETLFRILLLEVYKDDTEGHELVLKALHSASVAHKDDARLDGTTVLSQPIGVAVLLMRHLKITDPSVISAALLHLFLEDVKGWSFWRLLFTFNVKVALFVWFVSKKTDDNWGWGIRTKLAHVKLSFAPPAVQLLKLCDRFKNLLSISALPKWKQRRMLRDTVDFYVPLTRRLKVMEYELLEAIKLASRAD